jgi:PAS domain S-box-containing protein
MLKYATEQFQGRDEDASLADQKRRAKRCLYYALGVGLAAILLGLTVLAGWGFDIEAIKSIRPGWASMKPNTAVGFILAGAALALPLLGTDWPLRRVAAAFAIALTALGVITVIQYLAQTDLGIDRILLVRQDTEFLPGRPAPITAFNFTLLGAALLLLTIRSASARSAAQMCAVPALALSYLGLIGYALSASSLYQIPGFVSVAFHTALGQMALGLGVIAAAPETGLMRLLIGASEGSRLARRLMLLSTILFPALGWVRLKAEALGLVTPEMGVAIVIAITLVIFTSVILLPIEALIRAEGERKELNAAVAASQRAESTFRNVLNAAPDGMLVVDEQGRIMMANVEAEDLFGYTREELMGEKVEMLVPDRVRGHHKEHRAKFSRAPSKRPMSQGLKLSGRRKDGVEVPIEIALSPLELDTGQVIIVSIRDISERLHFYEALDRKNVELERASRAKDHFLANMSHELRTPLTVILGFARTLKMKAAGKLNPMQEKQVAKIETNADHLLALLNELLDLAKIESGDAEISLEPVDLPAILKDVATSMQPAAKNKGLDLTVQTPRRLQLARSSGRIIRQILENLISNSIKYTDEGSVRVLVETESSTGRIETRIHVIDTGIGIKPEHDEKLFQPFVRLDESGPNNGTGLGLHLSRNMAKALGGQLVYESVYGEGSTFTLVLVEDFNVRGIAPGSARPDAA